MMDLIPAFAAAVLFYAVIPLAGAFSIRRKWRVFRHQMREASIRREVAYASPDRSTAGAAGVYSFTGELQAIQGDNSIWINNGRVTVRAEMKGIRLYLLPTTQSIENEDRIEQNKIILPQDMPKMLRWEKVYSLAQGAGVFVSGKVFIENGTPVFRNAEEQPLLAVIFDGGKETILRRSIWSGRQLNEYWNSLTPMSLIAGSFLLFVLAYFAYRRPETGDLAMQTLLLSLFPVIPFLPPGLALYFLFRRLWRTGRYLRGERDLLRLMQRFSDYAEYSSCLEAMENHPEAKIRSCGIIKESELPGRECRVYLPAEEGCRGTPAHFFELLIIPGDPEQLAVKCRSRARWMEILAAASISSGFIINEALLYSALMWFI